ncbi:MAG: hypothetical protein QME64_04545 [bacterium]|nr:hypothetical protein [bacterium]
MADRMRLEIHFYSKNKLSISIDSNYSVEQSKSYEILLFCCYTLRQLVNFSWQGPAIPIHLEIANYIASSLVRFGQSNLQDKSSVSAAYETTNNVNGPIFVSKRNHSFTSFIASLKSTGSLNECLIGKSSFKYFFNLDGIGFSNLDEILETGLSVELCGPCSIAALLLYLVEKRSGDRVFLDTLQDAALLCGLTYSNNMLTIFNQSEKALQITCEVHRKFLEQSRAPYVPHKLEEPRDQTQYQSTNGEPGLGLVIVAIIIIIVFFGGICLIIRSNNQPKNYAPKESNLTELSQEQQTSENKPATTPEPVIVLPQPVQQDTTRVAEQIEEKKPEEVVERDSKLFQAATEQAEKGKNLYYQKRLTEITDWHISERKKAEDDFWAKKITGSEYENKKKELQDEKLRKEETAKSDAEEFYNKEKDRLYTEYVERKKALELQNRQLEQWLDKNTTQH